MSYPFRYGINSLFLNNRDDDNDRELMPAHAALLAHEIDDRNRFQLFAALGQGDEYSRHERLQLRLIVS